MSGLDTGNYRIYCASHKGDNRWLISNDTNVKVSKGSAITWQLENTSQGVTLNANGSYIAGDIKDGKVRLTSLGNGGSGAYWALDVSGEYYSIRCLDTNSGDKRYLDGNAEKSNVYLHADTTRPGSQWLLIPA